MDRPPSLGRAISWGPCPLGGNSAQGFAEGAMSELPDNPKKQLQVRGLQKRPARGQGDRPHNSSGPKTGKSSEPPSNHLTTQYRTPTTASQKALTFADRFFGGDFFPPNSRLHEWWETNCRYAGEEQARIGAEMLKKVPADSAKPEVFLAWFLDIVAGRFDIVAKRFLIGVRRKAQFPLYEDFLTQYMESYI
jgi:hypothetical protein